MNKLKLLVLSLLSLIFVNSCGALAIATLAGVGICGENRCVSYGTDKKSDDVGLYVIEKKNPLKAKEYVKSLMLRSKEKLEIEKGILVNVPKGLILKKVDNFPSKKYFFDKVEGVGLPIYIDYGRKSDKLIGRTGKLLETQKNYQIYEGNTLLPNLNLVYIKNFENDVYIHIYIYKDDSIPEFMEFYKDFMENL